ncbi:MAG: PAS domain-containing protein, partial [Chloroflexales bacterium]|nr:PAS domain-containing protein [Chloroflexales bacterium]
MLSSSQTPSRPTPPALREWREQTLGWTLRVTALAALPSAALDIIGSWQRGRLDWAAFDLAAIIFLFGLVFWQRPGYKLRVYSLLGIGILYALLTTLNLGLVGAGRLYVIFLVIISTMLLERREALRMWVAVTLLGTVALGAMGLGLIPIPTAVPRRAIDPNTMLVNTIILAGFSIVVGSAVLSLIARLTWSLRAAEEAIAERAAVNARLESLVEARTEELRRSQALLQGLLDNSPAAVYVKDLQGRYLLTNTYMQRVHSLSAEQMLGQRDVDLFGDRAEPWRQHELAVIESGQTIAAESEAMHPLHVGVR